MSKVKVNQDMCIGCGACAAIAPEVFELDEERLSYAKVEEVPAEQLEDAKDAVEGCPTEAIEMYE